MNNFLKAEQEIENEIKEYNLSILEACTVEELERIFDLDDEEVIISHAIKNKVDKVEKEGPNYFLVGGPYPNYA